MIRIGLIDSGVGGSAAGRVIAAAEFHPGGQDVVGRESQPADELGHGTRVAGILCERHPGVSLVSARVFFKRLVTTPAQVATALDWLVARDVRLVNMSFGLTADREELAQACADARDHGVLLVAAAPARGEAVYPAAYPGVIRATGDARCAPGEISWLDSGQADFGGHVRAGDGSPLGASIGCAWVSAALAALLAAHPGESGMDLVESLKTAAVYQGPEQRAG